jgi:cytochrome c peroxidase
LTTSATAAAVTSAPLVGEIQELSVDDPNDTWSGGTLVVAGQRVTLPRNLLIDLPANRLSLTQLFRSAPEACLATGESGLARTDTCRGTLGGGIATILANRGDGGNVIAGDVFVEKGVEALSGIVTFIDYTQGYLRVSGAPGDATTGTLVRINDPTSRFTIQGGIGCGSGPNCSSDERFAVDADNYTITFSTGYPACLPSSIVSGERSIGADASGVGDPFCPDGNRAGNPVADSTRFAPIRVGDPLTAEGNFEWVGTTRFLSAHTLRVGRALTTLPGAPDFLTFDETGWDAPGFQDQRVRALFILFTTLGTSQLDIFSLYRDPTTGDEHEFPLASTVGNPDTINQGIPPTDFGIAKINYDVDFPEGAPVRPDLSPCAHLGAAGFTTCAVGASLAREFAVLSPIAREIIARSRNKRDNPALAVLDVLGRDAPWGEYLTPVGVGHPEFVEINLDALATPFIFEGIPWNLDRRLSPGGCDGVCDAAPQPLTPFPFSGLDPAGQTLLPDGAANRILGFFPFGPGDVLVRPSAAPPAVPITAIVDPLPICGLPDSTDVPTDLPQSPSELPIGVPPVPPIPPAPPVSLPEEPTLSSLPPTLASTRDTLTGAHIFSSDAFTPTATANPLSGAVAPTFAPGDLADLRLELVPPGSPVAPRATDAVRLQVTNAGSSDVALGTELTVFVPEATAAAENPGWTTLLGASCAGLAAGSPCRTALPALPAGTSIELAFRFTLVDSPELRQPFIDFAARISSLESEASPENNEAVTRFAFQPVAPVPEALTGAVPPRSTELSDFIRDEAAAVLLGKLLFWDMQVGSDGRQACATCHFNAGADSRSINQVNPGRPAPGDGTFDFGGPNAALSSADFPFHLLQDPTSRDSQVLRSRDDTVSSQGVPSVDFSGVAGSVDAGQPVTSATFNVGGINVRQVEPRNSPTVINAVFNDRNFWDGRAQNVFNGVNPFGERDPLARVLARVSEPGEPDQVAPVRVRLRESSLASQAVGPPTSAFEMSWNRRTFADVGKKLLALTPLAEQRIAPTDSVLAAVSAWPEPGARIEYSELIQRAFVPKWWDAAGVVSVVDSGSVQFEARSDLDLTELAPDQYTQMMYNFPLFFGLAVQAYEATLVSDDSPFDSYANGDVEALSAEQRLGVQLFFGAGKCFNCHSGPVFTNARITRVRPQPLERMIMGDRSVALYDNGFYNIGVRPSDEDLGVGGTDPFGLPLSNVGLAQLGLFDVDTVFQPDEVVATRGSFKTPGLRNVALTAPYFHNGGQATLHQVVEFYNRVCTTDRGSTAGRGLGASALRGVLSSGLLRDGAALGAHQRRPARQPPVAPVCSG